MPGTPFLATPELTAEVLAVSDQELTLPVRSQRRVFFTSNPTLGRPHPLMVYTDFNEVAGAGQTTAWVSEHLQFDPAGRQVLLKTIPWQADTIPVLLFTGILGAMLWTGWRSGHLWSLLTCRENDTKRAIWYPLGLILSVRWWLLSLVIYFSGNLMCRPADEISYFRIAADLAHGAFSREWIYPIGLPLLYLPFLLIAKATSYFDIAGALSLTNAYLVAPACLALSFFILLRLSVPVRTAFFAVLVFSLIPFFYFPVEFHSLAAARSGMFKAICAWPDFNQASYHLWYLFTALGYNGLSDTPAVALMLFCTWLGLRQPTTMTNYCLASGVFGLACLVRISSILFAPLVAYTYWTGGQRRFREAQWFLWLAVAGSLISFLIVFAPQLFINAVSYGGVLSTPYVLHDNRAAEGFVWSCLASGIPNMIGCNYFYMVAGVVGLAFCWRCDRTLFIILTLMAVPVVIFHCGYPVAGASPVRFLLAAYFPLTAALVAAVARNHLRRRENLFLALIFTAQLILTAPGHRFVPPFVLGLERLPNGAIIAAGLNLLVPLVSAGGDMVLFHRKLQVFVLALVFLGIYHAGSPRLVFVLLSIILAGAVIEWGREVSNRGVLRRFSIEDSSPMAGGE